VRITLAVAGGRGAAGLLLDLDVRLAQLGEFRVDLRDLRVLLRLRLVGGLEHVLQRLLVGCLGFSDLLLDALVACVDEGLDVADVHGGGPFQWVR
jgi:hypothetical protein